MKSVIKSVETVNVMSPLSRFLTKAKLFCFFIKLGIKMARGTIGKPCKHIRCPNIVPDGSGQFCNEHKQHERKMFASARPDKAMDYNSKRWIGIRRWKINQNPMCEICERRFATQVHHIKPVRDYFELRYDLSNLQSVCVWCHAKETAKEISEREKKTNEDN